MPLSLLRRALVPALAALAAGCASLPGDAPEPAGAPRAETVYAVTEAHELLQFNAGQPRRIVSRRPVQGLAAGDALVGIDYRVARGQLYALSAGGRLYTLDVASGRLSPVGGGAPVAPAAGARGFDFNPVADRIRVVGADGQNLRLHPDTGALAATDPALAYAPGDARAGQAPQVVAAAYTYHPKDARLTTNYAIDRAAGTLVVQGSVEGASPVVSPNTGLLRTVGPLGTGAVDDAAFDIADVGNTALAALAQRGRTRLYLLDLASGRASLLGTLGDGGPIRGLAIAP